MDAAVKAKWLTALRSGEYEQAAGRLRRATGYCCLGVLASVVGWEHPSDQAWLDGATRMKTGLTMTDENQLSTMNDSGKSFTEIADYIEARL